ncbi:MAG TPA: DM13 domain-containing protein [Fimbriimonadaceae bacterium]
MKPQSPFELGKNRIEALSDGLFAVAMTILVLGFKLPNLPSDSPNVQVAPAILALWPAFVTYAIAFIGIGIYWVLHHLVYHAVRVVDRVLLWLNILFFLFLVVLPFSVQLVNQFTRAPIAPALFGANLAIVGWLLYFQWAYVMAHPNMQVESLPKAYKDVIGLRVAVAPAAATLTALICFWSVSTSLVVYVLLLPFYLLPARAEKPGHVASETKGFLTPRRALTAAAILAVFVGWFLFRPELLLVNSRVNEGLALNGAKLVTSGPFKGLAHETAGTASIYEVGGKDVLRFTGFSTSNGPDVHVYLVAAPDASNDDVVHHAGFINLGKMKGNEGDQNYELPAGTDLATYRSISLWCQRFNVNFGSCQLR